MNDLIDRTRAYAVDDGWGRVPPKVVSAKVIKITEQRVVVANENAKAFGYRTHHPHGHIHYTPEAAAAAYVASLRGERDLQAKHLADTERKLAEAEALLAEVRS